jgi:hypothetical protein
MAASHDAIGRLDKTIHSSPEIPNRRRGASSIHHAYSSKKKKISRVNE